MHAVASDRSGSGPEPRATPRFDVLQHPPRLRPGHHLFPGHDDAWRLSTPDGGFLRLTPEPERIALLAEMLTNGGGANGRSAEVEDLLAEMGAAGYLESPRPRSHARRDRVEIIVCAGPGAAPRWDVADALAGILVQAGMEPRVSEGLQLDDEASPPAVRIELAGWLPDGRWRAVDAWCQARSVPWHRCYHEGTSVHLGPFTVPGESAGYSDQRARRLAAADRPVELESYWSYLDAGSGVPDPPALDAAVQTSVAAALAADVAVYLRGGAAPGTGYEAVLDPETMTWRRHPVPPVTRDLLREAT
jgi:hypothetical protein